MKNRKSSGVAVITCVPCGSFIQYRLYVESLSMMYIKGNKNIKGNTLSDINAPYYQSEIRHSESVYTGWPKKLVPFLYALTS